MTIDNPGTLFHKFVVSLFVLYIRNVLFRKVTFCKISYLEAASSGSVNNEIHVGETELLDNVGSNENQVPRASDVAFSSLPVMHVTDQKSEREKGSLQNQHSLEADDENGSVISNCCPEAIVGCQVLKDSDVDVDVDPMPSHRGNGRAQRKYFASHWPEEAVTKALEVCLAMIFNHCGCLM